LLLYLGCRNWLILCHVLHPQSHPSKHTSLTGQDSVAYHSMFRAAACIVSKALLLTMLCMIVAWDSTGYILFAQKMT
jgi:hypothetical protein